MSTIVLKVPEKIPAELSLIQEEEGLGNRTSTVTFLIKYYFLTKKTSLQQSLDLLGAALSKIDVTKLPSAQEQIKDL